MVKVLLILYVSYAVLTDLLWMKISNTWILFGWILGLVSQVITYGMMGVLYFVAAAAAPIFLLWFLFVFGMLGAGDIKLLSAICGLTGVKGGMLCLLYTVLIGGVLALISIILHGNLKERFTYLSAYVLRTAGFKKIEPYRKDGRRKENMYFSIAIFLGVLFFSIFH